MRRLTAILCLTLDVLLGCAGTSWSADYRKGLDAFQRGDLATALREWELLAEQGDAFAQYNLGAMYASGNVVPKDYVYAYMWGNLAASNGYKTGGKFRDAVAKKMTPADISTAQKLARECVRKKYKGC
jgi:uncharacterized protein